MMKVPTTAKLPVSDGLRLSIAAYFVMHFFICILFDAQAVAWFKYPEILERVLLEWHTEKHGDFLMAERPIWFRSLVCGELLFQVPFFIWATFALMRKDNRVRIPCIAYGAHVATTFIPIYGEIASNGAMTSCERMWLAVNYLPFLIMPAGIAVLMWAAGPTPFTAPSKQKVT
eukprot:292603_1